MEPYIINPEDRFMDDNQLNYIDDRQPYYYPHPRPHYPHYPYYPHYYHPHYPRPYPYYPWYGYGGGYHHY